MSRQQPALNRNRGGSKPSAENAEAVDADQIDMQIADNNEVAAQPK